MSSRDSAASKGCRHADGFTKPILSESVVNSYRDAEEYAEAYAAAARTGRLNWVEAEAGGYHVGGG